MHNNKKACSKAGQKLKHVHFPQSGQAHQVRCLTRFTSTRHTGCTVLNTPLEAVPGSVRTGFFTSMVFALAGLRLAGFDQWPGSAQPYNSLWAKSASRLQAVLKYLAALSTGASINDLEGAATMAAKPTRAIHAHTRFSVYNFVRRFTGPVFAHRIAFRLGGAHHG